MYVFVVHCLGERSGEIRASDEELVGKGLLLGADYLTEV